jgi:putative addiction module component (TIGR02574 family)
MPQANELLKQVLELPLDERAKMAAELLESLSDAEEGVDEAWASEIRSRVAAVRAGELESTDWRLVLDEVEREVLGRRGKRNHSRGHRQECFSLMMRRARTAV